MEELQGTVSSRTSSLPSGDGVVDGEWSALCEAETCLIASAYSHGVNISVLCDSKLPMGHHPARSRKQAFFTWSPAQSFKQSTFIGWASFVLLSGTEKTLMCTVPCWLPKSFSPLWLCWILKTLDNFCSRWGTTPGGAWVSQKKHRSELQLRTIKLFHGWSPFPRRSLSLINCSSIDHILQDLRGFYDVLLLEALNLQNAIGFCMGLDSSQGICVAGLVLSLFPVVLSWPGYSETQLAFFLSLNWLMLIFVP